jgi:predicted transcriptional regulator
MQLREIVTALDLVVRAGARLLDREVTGGYAGDLLSDVLAHAGTANVWVTLQTHPNIVAVASTKDLAGIIIVNGRTPEPDTLRKAEEEKVPIMISQWSTFNVVCRLCELQVKGHEGVQG